MANYEHWAENKDQKMPETDFGYIASNFADIIDGEIKSGNTVGIDAWPRVRKTIRLKSGLGLIEINEYIDQKKHVIEKFEYDWKYKPGSQWKFHYDTFHTSKYWTQTVHYHQHDEPNPNKSEHARIASYRMRDLLHILESIRMIDRFNQEIHSQRETNEAVKSVKKKKAR
jgi:hypothetical protein